jgi:hypothetical protein
VQRINGSTQDQVASTIVILAIASVDFHGIFVLGSQIFNKRCDDAGDVLVPVYRGRLLESRCDPA